MLPKRKRLGRSEDLRLVIRTGRPTRVLGIFIRTRSNNHRPSRFAIAIPREAEKKATARNKMRRQLFSDIKKLQSRLREGFDAYITIRKDLFPLTAKQRNQRLEEVFQKSGLFNSRS